MIVKSVEHVMIVKFVEIVRFVLIVKIDFECLTILTVQTDLTIITFYS
jgi:hypothetical protein